MADLILKKDRKKQAFVEL